MPLYSTVLWLHLLTGLVVLANSQATSKPATRNAVAFSGEQKGDQCCHAVGSIPVSLNRSNLPQQMAFLVGAQKSGTTFLFHELVARHPKIKSHRVDICTPQKTKLSIPMKEPHFFDRIPLGDWAKYLQRFHAESDPTATFLDATPDYIHIPSTPCRIASVFPNAKIVVMLKDPVMRALSGWNMVRHQGKPGVKTFGTEVKHELKVLRQLKCSFELQQPTTDETKGWSRIFPWSAAASSSSASRARQTKHRTVTRTGRKALASVDSIEADWDGPAQGPDTQQHQGGPSWTSAMAAEADEALDKSSSRTLAGSAEPGLRQAAGNNKTSRGSSASSMAPAARDQKGSRSVPVASAASPAVRVDHKPGRENSKSASAASPARKQGTTATEPAPSSAAASGSSHPPKPHGSQSANDGDPDESSMSGASSSGSRDRWQRHPDLPSWNSCFRCDFSYCNGYTGPVNGHICRQDRAGTLGNLRRGLYVYQLEWWLQHFPAEQLLVINYEHFVNDREGVLDTIIKFLGQDPGLKKSPEFNKKKGFFTPHAGNASALYHKVIDELYRFYQHPNEELYRLMDSLGPSVGWNGSFPASFQQHLQHQSLLNTQLASMAVAEAAAVSQLQHSAAAQAALEMSASQARGKGRGLLKRVQEPDETPWYKTMMATWKQHDCKQSEDAR